MRYHPLLGIAAIGLLSSAQLRRVEDDAISTKRAARAAEVDRAPEVHEQKNESRQVRRAKQRAASARSLKQEGN